MRVMISHSTISVLSTFYGLVSCSFNLNTVGEDWSYTASDLANTTSQACKDAYSASIDCDYTLVGLVASMRPPFKPTSSDYDSTCTTTCSDSLASYMQGIEEACTLPGDKAQNSEEGGHDVYVGGTIDPADISLAPVSVIGEVFQYTFAQSCRKNSDGTYCAFESLKYADELSCLDECSIGFFQTAHNYPGSAYRFIYYWLTSSGSWWAGAFEDGWTKFEECGKAVSTVAPVSSTSVSSSNPTSSKKSTSISSSKSTPVITTSSAPESTTSQTSASATSQGSTTSDATTSTTSSSVSESTSTSPSTSAAISQSAPASSTNDGASLGLGSIFVGIIASSLGWACFLVLN